MTPPPPPPVAEDTLARLTAESPPQFEKADGRFRLLKKSETMENTSSVGERPQSPVYRNTLNQHRTNQIILIQGHRLTNRLYSGRSQSRAHLR